MAAVIVPPISPVLAWDHREIVPRFGWVFQGLPKETLVDPVLSSAERCHVHLVEQVAERGIRWRPPQLQPECLGKNAVVADCLSVQVPQALASSQDSKHGHQQQVPGRKAHAAAHPRVRARPQIADQVEISCGRSAAKALPSTRKGRFRGPHPTLTGPARHLGTDYESALALRCRLLVIWTINDPIIETQNLKSLLRIQGSCIYWIVCSFPVFSNVYCLWCDINL